MGWLIAPKKRAPSTIHDRLAKHGNLIAIGAHDGMTARVGERAGFDLIWGSGFEIATAFGVPDANILTMTEQLNHCAIMARAVDVPVVADCDNGFGNAVNAAFTVGRLEEAGIAGMCIEDNLFPKRCSFYDGVNRDLVPAREHALKVRACKEAQRSAGFFVIARTEAFIVGASVDEAVERGGAYAEAGADAVLVHSKQRTADELAAFAKQWTLDVPLVAVPTTYDDTPASALHELGYRIVIFANQGIRSAVHALETNLSLLRATGRAADLRDGMVSLERIFDLVGLEDLRAAEAKYLAPAIGD